jgi:hypothetical protein
MQMQATSEGNAAHHAPPQTCHQQPLNIFGVACHDAASREHDVDSWFKTGDDMPQQFNNSTGEGAKREVVYDKQSQKAFVYSLSPFVAKCMEGSMTKEAFVATLQTCCDEELASKEIGADTAVQLPAQRKRKNDQALPPGPRKVTNLQLRAHLVVLALSKLKEAHRKLDKEKV